MTGQTLTVTADCDEKSEDESVSAKLPVVDYYSSGGVWVRCATCGRCHYATADKS